MTSAILTPRLQDTFDGGLRYLRHNYGQNGLKRNQPIDSTISWTPSYHLRSRRVLIIAAEVSDVIYPRIIKEAFADILQYDEPISVYVVCPLEVYMADQKQIEVAQLRKHGIGIITVNDNGRGTLQFPCTPLAQNISEDEIEEKTRPLTANIRTRFKTAFTTYQTNIGQGLQEGGQIVEGIVKSIAHRTVSRGWASKSILEMAVADMIDELWNVAQLRSQRAALGGARNFARAYRNTASHPEETSRSPAMNPLFAEG